ncbi:response regulator [Paenibacillus aurantius]|uniref:Response regulator n=1 Tax=Paenibacillus aurantius TaxID=2918900 RepID=A0AA96LDJ7_9BACL|nr:response regulator [Paenibacillus aurantius]WNQ11209.1 response regulator [Paenibacillus aurantius]
MIHGTPDGKTANRSHTHTFPRILVAEDHDINRRVIELVLTRLGHEAQYVQDGEQARLALENDAYDLVFLDLNMPVMSGLEVARGVAPGENGERPVLVAISASVMPEDKEACQAAGMDEFIGKPFRVDSVREVIGKYFPAVEA